VAESPVKAVKLDFVRHVANAELEVQAYEMVEVYVETDGEVVTEYDEYLLWNHTIKVNGIKPSVKIKGISFDFYEDYFDDYWLYVKELVVDVSNEGDVPLYVDSETLEVYFDDSKYTLSNENILVYGVNVTVGKYEVVPPKGKKTFKLVALCTARPDFLKKDHEIRVSIAKLASDAYEIPALNPVVEDVKLGIAGDELDNVTLKIKNNWIAPISTEWIKVYLNGDERSFESSIDCIDDEGEVILDVLYDPYVDESDTITVVIGKTKVVKTVRFGS
jgi:hypothetical protein